MNANKRIETGISIRETLVKKWLREKKFNGEYLLVSTKPESEWSKKLHTLPPQTFLIVDLYTPVLLEKALTFRAWNPMDWMIREKQRGMVREFLKKGNHFLVANRRQREYWIEEAKTLGITLKLSDISVLPTGSGLHPSSLPRRQAGFILRPSAQRNVVLWFGGIYPWMDPEPLIYGFAQITHQFPDWKLRILGGFHPGTGYEHRYRRLMEHARRLIGEKQLEIVEWQSQRDLKRFLKDVACAVHLTKATREDYYAHRVRLLTLLNAGIGILTSGHDVISDLLVTMRAGLCVPSTWDTERLLVKVMNDPERRAVWSNNALNVEKTFMKQELNMNNIDD